MPLKMNGVVAGAALMLTACGSDRDAIGSYIGGDQNSKLLIQIREVRDQQIKGELTIVAADENGRTTAANRALTGTIDGELLKLSFEGRGGVSLISGTLHQDTLNLTFFTKGESDKVTLQRRDPSEFAAIVDGVRTRAAERKEERELDAVRDAELRQLSADQARISEFASALAIYAGNVASGTAQIDANRAEIRADRPQDSSAGHAWAVTNLQELAAAQRRQEGKAATFIGMCRMKTKLDCSAIYAALAMYRQNAQTLRAAAVQESIAYARAFKGKNGAF